MKKILKGKLNQATKLGSLHNYLLTDLIALMRNSCRCRHFAPTDADPKRHTRKTGMNPWDRIDSDLPIGIMTLVKVLLM